MGIGQSAGDLVSAWVTRCYSKLRFALSRRHGSSPAASAATNNDVPATGRWRSSDAVCSAREGPFWKPPYPSSRLFFAIVATQIAAVFMCSQGWLVPALPWGITGFVWAYNIVWMIVQDIVKLGLYCILDPAHSWKRRLFEPLRVPAADTQKAA